MPKGPRPYMGRLPWWLPPQNLAGSGCALHRAQGCMLGAVPALKVCSARGPQRAVGAPKLRLSDVLPLASFSSVTRAPQAVASPSWDKLSPAPLQVLTPPSPGAASVPQMPGPAGPPWPPCCQEACSAGQGGLCEHLQARPSPPSCSQPLKGPPGQSLRLQEALLGRWLQPPPAAGWG